MFAKLLKYEFKAIGKPVLIGGLAAVLAGVLGALMLQILMTQTPATMNEEILQTVMSLLLSGIYITIFAYAVAPEIFMLYRFYKHHFTDEGYLTFTVPATTHQILMASIVNILICSTIVMILSLVAFGVTLIPVVINPEFLESMDLFSYYFSAELVGETFGLGTVLATVLYVISTVVYSLIMPLFCITLGCLIAKKHKILCSFAVGYGVSMVVSMISGLSSTIVMLMEFTSDASYLTAYNISVLVPSLLFLILGVGGYFLMHRLIKNNLNI